MFGAAPVGSFGNGHTVAVATMIALAVPTGWRLAHAITPATGWALLATVSTVAALFKIGGEGGYEFIYFRF